VTEEEYTTQKNPFSNTRAALVEYEEKKAPRLRDLLDNASSEQDVIEYQKLDAEALMPLQEALYLDTKHTNSREKCMLMTLHEIQVLMGKK